ncbi:PREDICTED: complement component C1q receptor-like [Elephantulus edwardii]|uniref:complement component C1q receptor-like n=1 Tax=Elephantulus edwardii TaxID=28737 RepID=UPI0003F09BF7|nr:PREDICTED: complement component C1q receptor-like [Elephantulus edwardii]
MATSAGLSLFLLLLAQQEARVHAEAQAVVCDRNACYTAHWGKLSAEEAQLNCSTNGGNLATVRDVEEARSIQQALAQLLLPEAPPTVRMGKFWIGLQRERGKCLNPSLPLKGFSWVGGGGDSQYANWQKELKSTCISKRCVSLAVDLSLPPVAGHLPKWSEGPCGSFGIPVSNTEGFVCKFSFKGMCRPIALGGPGRVTYTTPFQATSSSLEAVPFASMAAVACGDEDKEGSHYFLCKEKSGDMFDWGTSGPLCASAQLGCSFNNGGCQQDCFEGGDGSFRCGCRPGFRLLDDLVTCASRNPCSSSPCTGVATCEPNELGMGYSCHCPPGYELDSSGQACRDVDECLAAPCAQRCFNVPGSFHCTCWVGFELQEGRCQDLDECALGQSPCAQACINTEGSFHCSCDEGYTAAGEDGTQCEDLDECADQRSSPCEGLCFNVPGSFHCGCLVGWELSPDGISCIIGPTSRRPLAGEPAPQEENQGSSAPSDITSSFSRGHGTTTEGVLTTRKTFLLSNTPVAVVSSNTLVPSVQIEPRTSHPTASGGLTESSGGDSVAKQSEDNTDGQKLLLFYVLGAVVAILLLLALALGLLVYSKRKVKRAEKREKKATSAADSYSWVPERAESRAMENQYR